MTPESRRVYRVEMYVAARDEHALNEWIIRNSTDTHGAGLEEEPTYELVN